jgi:hypothetical protein
MVRIEETHPGHIVTKAQLEGMGLVVNQKPFKPPPRQQPGGPVRASTAHAPTRPGRITPYRWPARRSIMREPVPTGAWRISTGA